MGLHIFSCVWVIRQSIENVFFSNTGLRNSNFQENKLKNIGINNKED